MEISMQMKLMAENIKQNGQKIIHVHPLKKREDAFSNQSRRVLLEWLVYGSAVSPWNYTHKQLKGVREDAQRVAESNGYQFIEVEE